GAVTCGGVSLVDGEFSLELIAAGDAADAVGLLPGGGYVRLDTVLTDELVAAGIVADAVRVLQQARKDAGLNVSDRIDATLDASDVVWRAVEADLDHVRSEILAESLQRASLDETATSGHVGDGES